jgi:hypothetical protein
MVFVFFSVLLQSLKRDPEELQGQCRLHQGLSPGNYLFFEALQLRLAPAYPEPPVDAVVVGGVVVEIPGEKDVPLQHHPELKCSQIVPEPSGTFLLGGEKLKIKAVRMKEPVDIPRRGGEVLKVFAVVVVQEEQVQLQSAEREPLFRTPGLPPLLSRRIPFGNL